MSAKLRVPPGFDNAPKAERIAFVEELWDRIARDPDIGPVPSEHKRILDARLDEYERNPRAGKPWAEVRDQMLAKFRSS